MTENKLAKINGDNAPDVWGDREEVTGVARRLRAMLPNGQNLSEQQLYAAAQYAQLSGLDPFANGFYTMPGGGIVQHYAVLVSWAQDKAPYADRYMQLSAEEREIEGVTEDAIAWKCYTLRNDRAETLGTYLQAGMPFTDALEFLAGKGIGIVTKKDRTDRKGKPMEPPKGWTWQKVAQKRALRNAIKLSHGVPTAAELRRYSQQVYQETPEGRLEGMEQQALEITARAAQMTPDESRVQLGHNVSLMRQPDDEPIGEDTEWEDVDYNAFQTKVIESIPFFANGGQVDEAINELELIYDPENEQMIFDALAELADKLANEEAAKQEKLL